MLPFRAKLVIAGVILLGAVGYLALAGLQKGWVYSMEVDQFIADETFHSQRVRLHGEVGGEDFFASPGTLNARFTLIGKGAQLPVAYQGMIPDLFQVGKDVVVEGRFDDAGVFRADVLMTKCASKYEPNSPHGEEVAATPASPSAME